MSEGRIRVTFLCEIHCENLGKRWWQETFLGKYMFTFNIYMFEPNNKELTLNFILFCFTKNLHCLSQILWKKFPNSRYFPQKNLKNVIKKNKQKWNCIRTIKKNAKTILLTTFILCFYLFKTSELFDWLFNLIFLFYIQQKCSKKTCH